MTKSDLQESSISVDNDCGTKAITKAIHDKASNQEKEIDVKDFGSWPDHTTDSLRQQLVSVDVAKPEVMLQAIKDY